MTTTEPATWIAPDTYGVGWDEYRLPPTTDLVGKHFRITFDNNSWIVDYSFRDDLSLLWTVIDGPHNGLTSSECYDASRIGHNIYFVDFVTSKNPDVSVSLIINLSTEQVLAAIATMPDLSTARSSYYERLGHGIDLSAMKLEYLHGVIGTDRDCRDIVPHNKTTDLVGKWMRYRYTENHIYEHVYVTSNMFAWHCLSGPDNGLACTEPCDYWKISDGLYMIVWRETVHPVCAISIINLRDMRSMGKQFCMNVVTGKRDRIIMGSYATLVGGRLL
jgi:hypothetical protein